MATARELIAKYGTDPEFTKEVDAILEDGKITMDEFKTFIKNHDLNVPLTELPNLIEKAKMLGLLK